MTVDTESYETLIVERARPGRLADRSTGPTPRNAMNARMMRRARGRVARARRRPRRAGDREHRRGHARSRPASTSRSSRRDRDALREQSRRTKRFELRFTAWHNEVCEAGDRGGQRRVRRRRAALRRRRRHRDRGVERARSSTRTCRSARSSVYETIALAKKSPMEPVLRMAFIGRHERMSARARVRARHRERGGRPARAAARRRRRRWPSRSRNEPADELAAAKRALWNALERTP